MAVFNHSTTTLIITPLESFPSLRSKQKLQSRDETPGGDVIVYDLGEVIEFLELEIKSLSSADKDALNNFIEIVVNWTSETFDFTDDKGVQYDNVRFFFDSHNTTQTSLDSYAKNLLLRLDV